MSVKPAWIQLECPDCREVWESTPDAVPPLGDEFECPYCRSQGSVAGFVKTSEGLTAIETFQGNDRS